MRGQDVYLKLDYLISSHVFFAQFKPPVLFAGKRHQFGLSMLGDDELLSHSHQRKRKNGRQMSWKFIYKISHSYLQK
jgi:hypothetical protein